jgi:hypothetical protein
MIYITTFFGKNVNGGNPDADPPTVYQVRGASRLPLLNHALI